MGLIMKLKFIILGLSLLLINLPINAQPGWFWQNPLPQGNDLFDVEFVNQNFGWAVGFSGTIIKTIDGGVNWFNQYSGIRTSLFGVSFSDIENGTCVGNFETILNTTDGGQHWNIQSIGTTKYYFDVFDINEDVGIIVGEGGRIDPSIGNHL